ncbi:MAG TPA: hypothetical protein VHM19_08815 [Polyangiales bacterium]|nr:hypothetical protein [Polyangiales bacterium]
MWSAGAQAQPVETPPPAAPGPAPVAVPAPEPAPPPAAPATQDQQALEAEFAKELAPQTEPPPTAPPAAPEKSTSGPTLALIDLAFDLLGAAGGSSASESNQRSLQAGGHDPNNRGFTIQNAELTLSGVVDPYLRGDVNIVLQIDPQGESTIELEEAYLTTLDLPGNLQIKAGQFFGAFGRMNATHPHAWDFVDAPVVSTRLLGGDGFRNPGLQLSWLTPLPFFTELLASVHNAQGETATSFRYSPGEVVAGRTLIDRPVRNFDDLAYLLRLRTSFDLGDEITLVPGLSALFGPNASASDTFTQIYGADLYVKWKPLANDHGWPFLAWQSEALYRRYQAAEVDDGKTVLERQRTLGDWGLYSQLVWGFARPWAAGVRYDYARGGHDAFSGPTLAYASASDPQRDQRQRYSAALTYYPSEFSKLRLQYSFDHAQFLRDHDAHSVYLQGEILFGAHGAHKF